MSCPECAGPQMVAHPAGILAIRHSNACQLRAAEDATAANDAQLGDRIRPATPTERVLLGALGYLVPAETYTQVTPYTRGLRHRGHLAPGTTPGGYRHPGATPSTPSLIPITKETQP